MDNSDREKTYISGHKNPDTDSIASAFAYSEFKKANGFENIIPIAPGTPNKRNEFLFNKFNVNLPGTVKDISPRVKDIMNTNPPVLKEGRVMYEALNLLREKHLFRIPVMDSSNYFKGMVSFFDLSNKLFMDPSINDNDIASDFLGRKIDTSIDLASRTLGANNIVMHESHKIERLHVYVAAMSLEGFRNHINNKNPEELAIVVGDREDIHSMAIKRQVRLLIITGNEKLNPEVIEMAKENGTSILKTSFDSATTVRRLKFSTPVEYILQKDIQKFSPKEKIKDIRKKVISSQEDMFPILNSEGILKGTIAKNDLAESNVHNLILVDHNNLKQAVDGASEIPIIEIIDHHNLDMPVTNMPITVINDTIGSTCTLITEKFRTTNTELDSQTAGILLGGIIADTIFLKSPTTTHRDEDAIKWLENKADINAEKLADEMFSVGSIIVTKSNRYVLTSDKKNYSIGDIKYSIAQVEEITFRNFKAKSEELLEELQQIMKEENLNLFGLLITNIATSDSILLADGDSEILDELPYSQIGDNLYDLPGILSRKKQLLPELIRVLSKI